MDSTNKTLFKEETLKLLGLYESRSFIGGRILGGGLRGSIGERIPHSEHSL
jgi:hypothetical protein